MKKAVKWIKGNWEVIAMPVLLVAFAFAFAAGLDKMDAYEAEKRGEKGFFAAAYESM